MYKTKSKGVSKEFCDQVFNDINQIVRECSEKFGIPMGMRCFQYSIATEEYLNTIFKKRVAVINAGTCYWRCVLPENDDGIINTHYGFKFDIKNAFDSMVKENFNKIEMHCWTAAILNDERYCIDLSTGHLMQRAISEGYTWEGIEPPKYLFTTEEKVIEICNDGLAFYQSNRDAIRITEIFRQSECANRVTLLSKLAAFTKRT